MRFDYLHSPRPLFVRRVLELRVPQRFQAAVLTLAGAIAIIAGAWGIESYRLADALKVESIYQQRYDRAKQRLDRANVYYARVRALLELDRRVRRIAVSGDADARTLAEIANRLPQYAWLTGITHDGNGLALEGRVKDLRVLSDVLHRLMHSARLRNPTLIGAAADGEGKDHAMKYEIHVDAAPQ